MTSLTVLTVLVMILGVTTRLGYDRALALGGVPVAGAAVVAGETAVPVFYLVALGTVIGVTAMKQRQLHSRPFEYNVKPPAVGLLGLFFTWCLLLTLIAPLILDGLEVVANGEANYLRAGQVTTSNIAQLVYLAIGIFVVLFLLYSPNVRPEIIGLAVGGTVVLSLWRYMNLKYSIPFPDGVFDNSPAYSFIETERGGGLRFRGILTEPAGLGAACLAAISYSVARFSYVSGRRKLGCAAIIGAALFMGVESTSATFVVAGAIMLGLAGVSFAIPWAARQVALSVLGTLGLLLVLAVSLWVLPQLGGYVDQTVDDKVGSSSFDDRGAADQRAFDNLVESGGLGTGLGSSRGSAFLPNLLSTTGLIGTAIFAGLVLSLMVAARRLPRYRPVIWTLISILVLKSISGPDLSDPSGVLWMSLGLLARAAWIIKSKDSNIGDPIAGGVNQCERTESGAADHVQQGSVRFDSLLPRRV